MRRFIKFSWLLLLIGAVLAAMLFSSWFYTYHRLSHEALVAEISFDPIGDKTYRANLASGDLCRVELYEIYGDQWRVEAQFIKWKYWANLVGLDSMYRLDRIEGRYEDVADQNERRKAAYALPRETAIDMVDVAKALGPLNFLLDASYGSSTFHHIDTDRLYKVYKTQTGLITRSEPRSSGAGGAQRLSIEINHACGGAPGAWRTLSGWLDGKLTGLRRI